MFSFTEDTFEQAVIELFENMGYTHIYAPDMDRTDYSRPLLDDVLRDCLVRLNRNLPVTAIDEAILKLNDFDAGSLLQKNMVFMDYLQNGITVKYAVNGEERSSVVRLIDYADAAKNDFYVVNQYTFVENGNNRRPDIILFINGMPLVLMELKSPSKDEVGAENAYNQIRNYMQDIPSMFYYNAICVISDLSTNKAGTITSELDRFMEWKTKDGDYENTAYAQFDTFYEGMFQKERLLDILKNFILFSGDGQKQFKILAGYHQYFAVRKAIEKAKIATKTDGKGCNKKTVQKEWLEELVVRETMKLIQDDAVIDKIVQLVMDVQNQENTTIPLLEKQLREVNKKLDNLMKAIEDGLYTRTTKERLEALEIQKDELTAKIADEKLKKPSFNEDFIRFWLMKFRKFDISQKKQRKTLIEIFVNAIFLYDDRMLITFNYKDGTQTVRFEDTLTADGVEGNSSDLSSSAGS